MGVLGPQLLFDGGGWAGKSLSQSVKHMNGSLCLAPAAGLSGALGWQGPQPFALLWTCE